MDHSDHTMGMSPTTTSPSDAMATVAMDHGEGGGHGGMGNGCKISMLINYNTIDSCFISEHWKISSTGMFAGSMIGIVLLAVLLEFLRRAVKEFDKYLVREHIRKNGVGTAPAAEQQEDSAGKGAVATVASAGAASSFRPTMFQQLARAILHTSQFTVAYFIMLLGKNACSGTILKY